ncbi:MAG: acyltransferase [Acidimicrobiales bacterium]|nr:acyltransferase [Acidimicrobiales bacterium]
MHKFKRLIKSMEIGSSTSIDGNQSAFQLLIVSLKEDITTFTRQFIRNTVAGSIFIPRALRWLLLNLSGLKIETPKIREDCKFNNSFVSVGKQTSINRACYFEGSGTISIGQRSNIGPGCYFLTSSHKRQIGIGLDHPYSEPILVGDRVWIGARSTLLPGTVIEDDCVVAAGSVVKGKLRSGLVYGGVPAIELKVKSVPSNVKPTRE